jgi:hypothetical protein
VRYQAILREEHISGLYSLIERLTVFVEDDLIVSHDPYIICGASSAFADITMAGVRRFVGPIDILVSTCRPTQIFNTIVGSDSIDVVDFRFVLRIGYERQSD